MNTALTSSEHASIWTHEKKRIHGSSPSLHTARYSHDSFYKIYFDLKQSQHPVKQETGYWPQAMLQKICESPVWWRIRYGATRALESNTTSRVPTRRPEGGTERRREGVSQRPFYLLLHIRELYKDEIKMLHTGESSLPGPTTLCSSTNTHTSLFLLILLDWLRCLHE